MVKPIRPNTNQRSNNVPVDDEAEAVIVVQYLFNPQTGEYEVATPGSIGSAVSIKRASDGALINPSTEESVAGITDKIRTATETGTVISRLLELQTLLDTVEPLLTTIRDEQQRRTDPLAAGSNIIGFTSNTIVRKIVEGKFWIAGYDVLTDATNTNAVFTLFNPATLPGGAANTKSMYITKIAVDTPVAGQIIFVRNQTDLPNPIREAFNPNTNVTGAPVGEFHSGNLTPAGGTTISPTRKVFAEDHYEFEGFVILKPGQIFSARVAGAATGSRVTGLVHWYEE